jgi:arginase
MVTALYDRVGAAVASGHFPLIYGADCAVLLAAVPALADVAGSASLVFIDSHEDATSMEASDTGEAANMEVALLLGMTGKQAPEPLRGQADVLRPEAIVMLGMRDDQYRAESGVPASPTGCGWLPQPTCRPIRHVPGLKQPRRPQPRLTAGGCTPTWMY